MNRDGMKYGFLGGLLALSIFASLLGLAGCGVDKPKHEVVAGTGGVGPAPSDSGGADGLGTGGDGAGGSVGADMAGGSAGADMTGGAGGADVADGSGGLTGQGGEAGSGSGGAATVQLVMGLQYNGTISFLRVRQ